MAKQGSFFVRLCYGYVGRYKDTSKMTTKEVIEEFLKRKGVSSPSEYFKKKFRQRNEYENSRLPDETLPRSIGAKWDNYEINMPDGSKAIFVEGSKIQNKEVFAGYGKRIPIRDVDRLNRQYNVNSNKWKKVKGIAQILEYGKPVTAEVHWYEEPSVGKVEFKFKRYV